MRPVVLAVAITGSVPRKADNPAVPITVAEQVESTHEAFEAGASLVHIHVRNPDETPSSMTRNGSDAWRGTVDVGDCLIYVALDGPHGAPHLTLSNSLGSDLTMWDPQLGAFSEHFRVIRYVQGISEKLDSAKHFTFSGTCYFSQLLCNGSSPSLDGVCTRGG
jgi:hypothetical protein